MDVATVVGARRARRVAALLLVSAGFLCTWAHGQDEFLFDFEGPDSVCGSPGVGLITPYYATLSSLGDSRAAGWNLGVIAEGGAITDITTAGTAVEELFQSGFERTELTTGPGNEGAVSAVVLALAAPVTLPAQSTERVAALAVLTEVPELSGSVVLRYVDGLVGSGQPISLKVTDETASTVLPQRAEKDITVVSNAGAPCDEVNPAGWIRTAGWNLLFPLGNPYGCDAGGPTTMLGSWTAPRDIATEAAEVGETWEIDLGGAALATEFYASSFYGALGLGESPVWVSTGFLRDTTGHALPSRNTIDFQQLIDVLNTDVAPDLGTAPVFAENVLGIAQTYVENTSGGPLCVDLCTASSDSLQVWLDGSLVANVSSCRPVAADCSERSSVQLEPGVHRITVLVWAGKGDWAFKLGVEDPVTGEKLTNDNQDEIVFLGAEAPVPVPPLSTVSVTRKVTNPDACPEDRVVVTLRGEGVSGTVKLTETYSSRDVTSTSFSEVSDGGVVEEVREDATVVGYRITWNVDAATLTDPGVTYEVAPRTETSARPAGLVDDCVRVVGEDVVEGPRTHTGPIGILDDAHDVGRQEDLPGDPGTTVLEGASYTLGGAGRGFGDGADSFHFAYQRVAGDFSLTVRVADRLFPSSRGRTSAYGLMARLDCSPNARHSMVHANLEADPGPDADHPRGDAVFWRFRRSHRVDGTSDASQSVVFPDPDGAGPSIENQPDYFRLERRGNTFLGYARYESEGWRLIGLNSWQGLAPGGEVLVGLVHARGNASADGIVSFGELAPGLPEVGEIFDDDTVVEPEVIYTRDFTSGDDGELPDEFQVNTVDGAGVAGGARGGAGFTPRVVDGRIRMTEEGVVDTATSIFLKNPVSIGTGKLIIEYTVYATHSGITPGGPVGDPNPGYGLTLAVVAGTDPTLVGESGKSLGYGGITKGFSSAVPSLAVEADTWTDAVFNEGTGSPENDGTWHVGVDSGGSVESLAVRSTGLPSVFSPEGVRHRVVITSEGQVQVFLLQTGGGEDEPVIEASVVPLGSQGHTEGLVGFTASTGDGTQTSEIDEIDVRFVECSDAPETAVITGPTSAFSGDIVEFDGSASSAGEGDADEVLTYSWQVSGDAQITGPSDGPVVAFIIGDGDAIARLQVDDGHCANVAMAEQPIAVRAPNWVTYDMNNDGQMDLSDAVVHLGFMYQGLPEPECYEAADFNGDGQTDLTDAIGALGYLYRSEAPPVAGIGCQGYASCGTGKGCGG